MKKGDKGSLIRKTEARREALSRADISLYASDAWLRTADRMSRYASDSNSRKEKNKFLNRAKIYREKANHYINTARRYERIGSGQSAPRMKGLGKMVSGLTAVVGIFLGFFLLAPKINGAVVGVVGSSQNFLGVVVLFAGFIGAYLFFKKR